ncbi:MAG TPA: alginate lyase family protein [Niabella sp.]
MKRRWISINRYVKYDDRSIRYITVTIAKLLATNGARCFPNNRFYFIGLTHTFPEKVDWNFGQHGKLWNYNLQYFEYLLDDAADFSQRLALIQDLSIALLAGSVKLEPYPVSLRIINTSLFISSHQINDEIINLALKRQVNYLENNLEYHLLGNHLLENCYALFIVAHVLKDIELNRKAYSLLKEQLKEQILRDGAHYECSPMYHSILLAKLLLCIDVARNNVLDAEFTELLENKAAAMMGWLISYSFPDGSWALMNDAALDIAPTTKQLQKACEALNIQPIVTALKESGFRKLKGTGWEVLVKTGNIQPAYQPGHTHADLFTFCIWSDGKQLVIDPGTSTYNNNEQRRWERGTLSHNTVTVAHQSQSDVWSVFRMGKRAKVILNIDTGDVISGSHNGYKRYGVLHERSFNKISPVSFTIYDNVVHSAQAAYITHSHILFAPGTITNITDSELVAGNMSLTADCIFSLEESAFAERFNTVIPTKRIRLVINKATLLTCNFE